MSFAHSSPLLHFPQGCHCHPSHAVAVFLMIDGWQFFTQIIPPCSTPSLKNPHIHLICGWPHFHVLSMETAVWKVDVEGSVSEVKKGTFGFQNTLAPEELAESAESVCSVTRWGATGTRSISCTPRAPRPQKLLKPASGLHSQSRLALTCSQNEQMSNNGRMMTRVQGSLRWLQLFPKTQTLLLVQHSIPLRLLFERKYKQVGDGLAWHEPNSLRARTLGRDCKVKAQDLGTWWPQCLGCSLERNPNAIFPKWTNRRRTQWLVVILC